MSGGEVTFFNLPLLEQLHRRPYHLVKLRGEFNLAKLVRDHKSQLLRSETDQTLKKKAQVERLMFSLGEGVFAVYESRKLMVYAPITRAAAEFAKQMKKYRKRERTKAGFRLIGTREFRRLTREEAKRLAEAKGLSLPDQNDFSLAELYCGAVASPLSNIDRHVGFAQ